MCRRDCPNGLDLHNNEVVHNKVGNEFPHTIPAEENSNLLLSLYSQASRSEVYLQRRLID
jgi:hypothetical protein